MRTKSRSVRDEHLGSADGAPPVAVSGQVQHFLALNNRLFDEERPEIRSIGQPDQLPEMLVK